MDNKQIRELMAAMERWKIKKLSFKDKEGEALELEREGDFESAHLPSRKEIHSLPSYSQSFPYQRGEGGHEGSKEPMKIPQGQEFITSPMVGTFYSAPSPEDPPFVKVGDRVDAETVVCIVEAMKVMNEVKAGMSGVIREICVENAQPVEFGAKLFRIE